MAAEIKLQEAVDAYKAARERLRLAQQTSAVVNPGNSVAMGHAVVDAARIELEIAVADMEALRLDLERQQDAHSKNVQEMSELRNAHDVVTSSLFRAIEELNINKAAAEQHRTSLKNVQQELALFTEELAVEGRSHNHTRQKLETQHEVTSRLNHKTWVMTLVLVALVTTIPVMLCAGTCWFKHKQQEAQKNSVQVIVMGKPVRGQLQDLHQQQTQQSPVSRPNDAPTVQAESHEVSSSRRVSRPDSNAWGLTQPDSAPTFSS